MIHDANEHYQFRLGAGIPPMSTTLKQNLNNFTNEPEPEDVASGGEEHHDSPNNRRDGRTGDLSKNIDINTINYQSRSPKLVNLPVNPSLNTRNQA